MKIFKEDAGDFVNDSIAFTVAVLLVSKQKMGGIDKVGARVGSRRELRISKNNWSGRN